MTSNVKLDPDGKCNLCKKVSLATEHVECFVCRSSFHAVCPNTSNDDKLATKTTVTNFLLSSTKKNFMFFCDICLTTMERNMAETDTQRINSLETKIGSMSNQLSEIKDMLMVKGKSTVKDDVPIEKSLPVKNSIWFNKERLETVKAPPVPSVLVVGKTNEVDKDRKHMEVVEKVIMENNIGLQKSYKNKNGELIVVCDSREARDNLSTMVSNVDERIPTISPNGKRPTVAIVGLYKEYSKEEITAMVVKQNQFVKNFVKTNNIDEHFKVLAVRPTKRNQNVFQVFASVSAVLRDGIKQYNDKLTLGLTSCKVYDQYHVKRCNKCQLFGHYIKDCTSTEAYCAQCGDMHETSNCSSTVKKCINCVRSDAEHHDHYAFDMNCPAVLLQQELLKNVLEKDRSALLNYTAGQTT
jgi:hypothetical protein